jgi:squalene cyclase
MFYWSYDCSDCTAEGLKAVLSFHGKATNEIFIGLQNIEANRLFDAVNVILSLHNADGGWATYENNRGYRWYEMLNPSEVFGDIMIDYSYVECSSACITALKKFSEVYPEHRTSEVLNAIQAGRQFIKSIQRKDGSWYGSWGVRSTNRFFIQSFSHLNVSTGLLHLRHLVWSRLVNKSDNLLLLTYHNWIIEGLVAAGENPSESDNIRRGVQFLLSKQNPNGGWGESYVACVNKSYPSDGTGEVCNNGRASCRRNDLI